MTRFESTTQRLRSERMIEQQETAAGQVMWSFVWLVVGIMLFVFGTTLEPQAWWISFGIASMLVIARGIGGIVLYTPLYLRPIHPDELIQRVYSGEDAPAEMRLESRDGNTIRLSNLTFTDEYKHEIPLFVERLKRSDWYFSRRALEGKKNEPTLTNLNARYPEMLSEMQRIGALYRDGNRWRVEEWAREQLSPTPNANE